MLRFAFYLVLLVLFVRAMVRMWGGVKEGLSGQPAGAGARPVPQRGVQMVRDPVCGTFVVPERAVPLAVGGERHYFCSIACRDKYRTVEGRTA